MLNGDIALHTSFLVWAISFCEKNIYTYNYTDINVNNIPSLMKYGRRIPAEKCWDDVSQGVVPSNVEIFNK